MLPMDWNIYVTTSTNMYQTSWATYCPGTRTPPPTGFDICIGDLYNISWLEDRYFLLLSLVLYTEIFTVKILQQPK